VESGLRRWESELEVGGRRLCGMWEGGVGFCEGGRRGGVADTVGN